MDLFVKIGIEVMKSNSNVHFLWIGSIEKNLENKIHSLISKAGLKKRIHFPGFDSDSDIYYAGADVYALTSREDPFPSVDIEALEVGGHRVICS